MYRIFLAFRCGLPVCNQVCEEGPLHRNYECPWFAKAFDKTTSDTDDSSPKTTTRQLPKIEKMNQPSPLYAGITTLRMLLRQKDAEKNEEKVATIYIFWGLSLAKGRRTVGEMTVFAPD
jgi:hypothetical protein